MAEIHELRKCFHGGNEGIYSSVLSLNKRQNLRNGDSAVNVAHVLNLESCCPRLYSGKRMRNQAKEISAQMREEAILTFANERNGGAILSFASSGREEVKRRGRKQRDFE
ncbi:hypothetical protein Scep_004290 [Stephania cephalantha]|uniref:Uncharacterized protein n=1 Tax=Stephania cephalantha TaxID=152367 RepID=A0AAP0KS76_9MAGN